MKKSKLSKKYFLIMSALILFSVVMKFYVLHNFNIESDQEECWVGTIANEFIVGTKYSLIEYVHIFRGGHYYSGRIIEAAITSLFFLLTGISGYAIKYTYITISTACMISLIIIVNRFYGKREAFIVAGLLAMPFPTIIMSSLHQNGPHHLGVLFDIFIIGSYLWLMESPKNYKKACVYGVVSGISIWLNYFSAFMFIATFISYIAVNKKKAFISLIFILVSLAIGLSPLIYSYDMFGKADDIVNIKLDSAQQMTPGLYLERVGDFFNEILPRLFYYTATPDISAQRYLVSLFFLSMPIFISLAYYLKKKRLTKELFAGIYPVIFISTYLVFYDITFWHEIYDQRHLLMLPYLTTISIALIPWENLKTGKLRKIIENKKAVMIFVFVLVLMNTIFTISVLVPDKHKFFAPYCYESFGHGMAFDYFKNAETTEKKIAHGILSKCSVFGEEYYFDCLQGTSITGKVDNFSLACEYQTKEFRPFCQTQEFMIYYYTNYIWQEDMEKNENIISFGKKVISSAGTDIFEGMNEDDIIMLLTIPDERYYNSYFRKSKIDEIYEFIEAGSNQKDILVMLSTNSYALAKTLGPRYMDAENILCIGLQEDLKPYCYFALGKRIAEVNFLSPSTAKEKCMMLEEQVEICLAGARSVYKIYGPEK